MEHWENDPVPPRVGSAATARQLGRLRKTVSAVQLGWPRILVGTVAWVGSLLSLGAVYIAITFGGDLLLTVALALLFVGLFVACRWLGPRTTLYLFERGAVVDHPRCATAEAFGWTDLTTSESYRVLPGSDPRRRALSVEAAGRTVFTGMGLARVRLADALAAMEPARTQAWIDQARPAGRPR